MNALILNAIQTPDGTVLESHSRHDYVTHTDANGKEYMVDGGLAYVRTTLHDDQISLALYDDEPHEVQREVLKWGTRGVNGDQPLTFKPISEMDTAHIGNVIGMQNVSPVHRKCMAEELRRRK